MEPASSATPVQNFVMRLVRSRQAGSRLPEGTICCTRPGRWGNPYRDAATFRMMMERGFAGLLQPNDYEDHCHMQWIVDHVQELRGKTLACWCKKGKPCHADVLIEFANR
jgi:hypothetical protein